MVLVKIYKRIVMYLSILAISGLYEAEDIPVDDLLICFVEDLMPHDGIEFEDRPGDPETPVFSPEPDGSFSHASHRVILSGYDKDLLAA